MYNRNRKIVVFSTLIVLLLAFISGCTKQTIEPPTAGSEGSGYSGGTEIKYPPADSTDYTESSLGQEGTLDDTAMAGQNNSQEISVNTADVVTTEEYKMEHGRSSVGLSPIYFDFDQAAVRPDMGDRMANNALFLQQNPAAKIVIEGNCDDRGTKEYNLALGERRALNAKQYLINLGVESFRIRTVSYGEEQPLFTGQDETSYAQNRRDDFIIE